MEFVGSHHLERYLAGGLRSRVLVTRDEREVFMAAVMRGGRRQQLLGLGGFLYSDSRSFAALGLGRLQLGEIPPKNTIPEWVPPADEPSPRSKPRKRGAILGLNLLVLLLWFSCGGGIAGVCGFSALFVDCRVLDRGLFLLNSGQAGETVKLWRELFADPLQWSDVRAQKV